VTIPATVDTQAEDTCGLCHRPLGDRAYAIGSAALEPYLWEFYCSRRCAFAATAGFLQDPANRAVLWQLMDLRAYRRSDASAVWQPRGRVKA